ncbi:MAG: tetratricopeptide repeat protein [Gemmatimonadota bacterium]|nr:tetratricopeptide repeat protein [Gemmatimonadota bacterium]
MRLIAGLLLGALSAVAAGRAAAAQTVAPTVAVPRAADAAFARARTLVTEGNGAAGRALVDSLLQAHPAGSPVWVEGLWWRAVLAEQAASAERDLLRLAVEHPVSPRAPEALMRLGQLELARGARDAAVRHFERLISDHPDSPLVAAAYAGKGRALIEGPRGAEGCVALAAARSRLTVAQVELRNQIEFAAQRCSGVEISDAHGAVPAPTAAAGREPSAPAVPPRTAPAAPAGPRVIVAAGTYPTRAKAAAQLRRVEAAGFEARVGLAGPGKYRVFVGEPMPRAEASALQRRLVAKRVTGVTLLVTR